MKLLLKSILVLLSLFLTFITVLCGYKLIIDFSIIGLLVSLYSLIGTLYSYWATYTISTFNKRW